MFPEIISNSLASLQQDRVRYVKSVIIDLTPEGEKTSVRFANGAIRVRRRFTYEQVSAIAASKAKAAAPADAAAGRTGSARAAAAHARSGHDPAQTPPQTRSAGTDDAGNGLEYDNEGRVSGAHFRKHDISHQIIEEFMLAANEAVAEHLDDHDIGVLCAASIRPRSRTSCTRSPTSPAFSATRCRPNFDRFALQRILEKSATRPEMHAVHYALLRSLKQAVYSPGRGGSLCPGERELLPFHVADSPLSRSDGASAARPVAANAAAAAATRRS